MADIAPDIFYEQFSEEKLNNVPDPVPKASKELVLPPAPRKEVAPGTAEESPAPADDLNPDEVDPIESLVGPDGDLSKIEAEEVAELITDGVGILKIGLSELFKARFEDALRKDFKDDERVMLNIVIGCDQENKLTMEKLKPLSEKLELDFAKLMDVKVRYVQTKEKWQAKEYLEYQKKGIKRNAKRVAEAYLHKLKLNPITMLVLYIIVTLGGDALRIGTNLLKKDKKDVTA